jgi:hypothetical protein
MEKQILGEKIESLNDLVESEREARDMWVSRFEKEHNEHTEMTTELLQSKNVLKDMELDKSNFTLKNQML